MVKELWSQIEDMFCWIGFEASGGFGGFGFKIFESFTVWEVEGSGVQGFLKVKGCWTLRGSVFKVFEVFGVKGCCSISTLCFKFIHGPRI